MSAPHGTFASRSPPGRTSWSTHPPWHRSEMGCWLSGDSSHSAIPTIIAAQRVTIIVGASGATVSRGRPTEPCRSGKEEGRAEAGHQRHPHNDGTTESQIEHSGPKDVRIRCLAGGRAFAEVPQHLTPAGIGWRFSELACEQIVALAARRLPHGRQKSSPVWGASCRALSFARNHLGKSGTLNCPLTRSKRAAR